MSLRWRDSAKGWQCCINPSCLHLPFWVRPSNMKSFLCFLVPFLGLGHSLVLYQSCVAGVCLCSSGWWESKSRYWSVCVWVSSYPNMKVPVFINTYVTVQEMQAVVNVLLMWTCCCSCPLRWYLVWILGLPGSQFWTANFIHCCLFLFLLVGLWSTRLHVFMKGAI